MERLQELMQEAETVQKVNLLQEQVRKEIFSYPSLTGGQRVKRILRTLAGRRQPPVDSFFWPNALLAQGLSEMWKGTLDNKCMETLEKYFNRYSARRKPIHYMDNILNGMPLLELYAAGGKEKYEKLLHKMAAWLKAYPLDERGNMVYRLRNKNLIFADGIGMVCPFLCRYGTEMEDRDMVKLGVVQMVHFVENAMDEETGLPYHGFDSGTGVKCGAVGWGRAAGWVMTGIADSLAVLPEDTPQYSFLKNHLAAMAEASICYQREDGSFSWLLPAREGEADTSATAMIASALLGGMISGILDDYYEGPVYRAASFLLSCIKDGRTARCSAECGGFGLYPQIFGAYPWGNGAALKLFGMMEEAES